MKARLSPLLLLLAAACSSANGGARDAAAEPDPGENAPRIPVTIDTEKGALVIQSEIADNHDERMRGLMYRRSMKEHDGMIFLFPNEQQQSFWMRNCFIPLDMIFIKSDRTILGIVENATPGTDTPRMVPGLSQFVLEVNGGLAAKEGIKAGQTVSFYAPVPTD